VHRKKLRHRERRKLKSHPQRSFSLWTANSFYRCPGLHRGDKRRETEHNKDTLKFGITSFFLDINQNGTVKSNEFSFSAPTTKKNLFRVLSALSLNKAILLERPPGVGKSSLIENIGNIIGLKHRENQHG
jgi:hypothetical protein